MRRLTHEKQITSLPSAYSCTSINLSFATACCHEFKVNNDWTASRVAENRHTRKFERNTDKRISSQVSLSVYADG